MYNRPGRAGAAFALLGIIALAGGAHAQGLSLSRGNLAKNAAFTVTQTLAPKGGAKFVRVFKVEVKGDEGRVDFSDPSAGSLRYVANKKGLFLYIPGSQSAMKQAAHGGVEPALQQAFAQAKSALVGAKKAGATVVSGQPVDIYRNERTHTVVYIGKKPGYRLPVRVEQANEGGTTSLLVTDIRLNPTLSDAEFALPAGTHIEDSSEGASAALPGGTR
jgi:outer membrane lipoprotein-sorting protein